MPLYQHKSGERVHTVPGSAEDERLASAKTWRLVDESKADKPARRATTSTEGVDVRSGSGRATIDLSVGKEN